MSSLLPEPESSRMTTSRNFQHQKSSGSSFLGFRSPLSSLFSFRKSAKQNVKPPSPQERHSIFSISGQILPNTDVKKKFETYHSARSVRQIASFFEGQHKTRNNDSPKATVQLEKEVFQVLGDLDQKLAQEQSHSQTPRTSRLESYKHGRQYGKEDSLHNTSEAKNMYSGLPSHDGKRTVSLEETQTTYATYQPKKFSEIYLNRQHSASKAETSKKPFYKKRSLLFSATSNTSATSSSNSGSFSSSSLQQSTPGIDLERTRPHKSKRTPVTSIKWNNAFPSEQPKETGRPFKTQSALDLTILDKYSQHSRVSDLFKYNTPRVRVSPTNDFSEFRNINTEASTSSFMDSADNRSTGYYKTDSPSHRPEVKYATISERYWEEESKKNSFNNEMSKTLNDNSSGNDKEAEPMEVESELIILNDSKVYNLMGRAEASSILQTESCSTKADAITRESKMSVDNERCSHSESDIRDEDIPVDRTFHEPIAVSSSHTVEPKIMNIDAPNVFLNSRNTSLLTSVDIGSIAQEDSFPPKTERLVHNPLLNAIKKCTSLEHKTSSKIDTPSFKDIKSSIISDRKNTTAYNNRSSDTSHTGGRFAWMNKRRGSKDNQTEGFRSDTLKFQKRNASSLPDLLDQDSDILSNNVYVSGLKKSCENVDVNFDATLVPDTKSSRISDDLDKRYLENYSKYEQPCVQNTIYQEKNLGSRNFLYPQKPYLSDINGTYRNLDKKTTYTPAMYQPDRLREKRAKYKQSSGSFMSDTLKYKQTNASSLPDLLDQESDHFSNDLETIVHKTSCEPVRDYHPSNVLETKSLMSPDEKKEMYFDTSTRYGLSSLQHPNQLPKTSSLNTSQSSQKIFTLSSGSELDKASIKTEEKTTDVQVAYRTAPFSHVPAKFKSVNFNRGRYNEKNISDSNNNNFDDGSKIKSGYIYQRQNDPEPNQEKASKCDTSSKPNRSVLYRKDVVSSAHETSTDQQMQVEQGYKSERNLNQNSIYQLDERANKSVEYTEPVKVIDSSRFPVSEIVKEHSEGNILSRGTCLPPTENKATNILRKHLLVTPEPFKRNVHISVIPKSEWNRSTSGEDGQTQTSLEEEIIKDFAPEDETSPEGLQLYNTYSCQQVVENTEVYESITNSSYPEVDKIEYRKVVSVYYSLPRKFSRKISDLSKNNLKNIDKTLEQNRAPSAILDKISSHHKEDYSNDQNSKNTTAFTDTIHNDKGHSADDISCKMHLLNFHIIPLQTSLMKNDKTTSGDDRDDLVNKFSSLHISTNEGNYTAKEEQKNKNEYSPIRSSPRHSPNTYYTLPNRKSGVQELERNVLERDIAMVRDRFNPYSSSRNVESSPVSQDVFTSPMFSYDNLNCSPGYDFMHFQENNEQDYNINNNFAKDGGFYERKSMDESLLLREDLPSIYKSKSSKDLSHRKSYNTEHISPHMEYNTSPQSDYNYPSFNKSNDVVNRTRPSYCSEFVQKKMKPINAKKFSFSSDRSSQESVNPRHAGSYSDTFRISDVDSSPVFYSPNDNYPSHVPKHFGQRSPKHCRNPTYSNLYRSKSMKLLNTDGQENVMDYRRKSDGSFSSKSYGGTLRNKSPTSGETWNRRFSDEILDENDNWPVSEEHKPICTSKSLDYGIFGKEQQEAILNNVKRSLNEGRLWRPSFLKNPSFLRTEEYCSSQEVNPVGRSPEDIPSQGPSLKDHLNIHEDEPVSSDLDSDTTTDDEYYLDENDKESEL
ncbi:exophilin-5 isoform X2 [Phyllobates terribilis]|uniref:exophilin-5 isoform X2 n=1 Tax=Phyllobates terribilis TaxID=111132 RepID=UPI003CCB4215